MASIDLGANVLHAPHPPHVLAQPPTTPTTITPQGCRWWHLPEWRPPRHHSTGGSLLPLLASTCCPPALLLLASALGESLHIELGAGLAEQMQPSSPTYQLTLVVPPISGTPCRGVYGPYNASRDPWLNPAVRDYMRFYVNQVRWLAGWMAGGGRAGAHLSNRRGRCVVRGECNWMGGWCWQPCPLLLLFICHPPNQPNPTFPQQPSRPASICCRYRAGRLGLHA